MTMLIPLGKRAAATMRPALLAAALAAAPACGSSPAPAAPAPAARPADAPPPAEQISLSAEAQRAGGIAVAAVAAEPRAATFETPAVLQVNETRTARLGSLVEGVVTGADVQVGERVRRGQRLARIHGHAVHDAWADYRKAVAEQRRATAELDYATAAEARAARLLAAKAMSQQEMERATADKTAAEQALAVAESEVRRSLDELEHLGIGADEVSTAAQQDAAPLVSPLAGVVLERLVTSGTAVTVGTPLYVVSDLATLWAVAEIDEARLPRLAAGGAATVVVAAYPDRRFSGRVLAIGDSLNPETRRVTARIEVDNREGLLKPQMFATVQLAAAGAPRQAIVAPAAAVQQLDGQPVVFVEVAPGIFRRQPVTLGEERDGHVELTGLAPGARIAVAGAFLLKSKLLESEQPE